MADRISLFLGVAALGAVLVGLVALPPAGILVAIALGWWMLRKDCEEKQKDRLRWEQEHGAQCRQMHDYLAERRAREEAERMEEQQRRERSREFYFDDTR